jgi:hypothetical protein
MLAAALARPSGLPGGRQDPSGCGGRPQARPFPAPAAAAIRASWLEASGGHPAALLERAKAVYVVTSQLGFEALLWGRPVHCFGMPFYAGWGLTAMRCRPRRAAARPRPVAAGRSGARRPGGVRPCMSIPTATNAARWRSWWRPSACSAGCGAGCRSASRLSASPPGSSGCCAASWPAAGCASASSGSAPGRSWQALVAVWGRRASPRPAGGVPAAGHCRCCTCRGWLSCARWGWGPT